MSLCSKTDLGNFSQCDPVDIDIDEEVFLTNMNTARKCTYEDGNFGILAPGTYIAITESGTYKFKVV
jgi:hypothetical protein